jgi:hypothetical protein
VHFHDHVQPYAAANLARRYGSQFMRPAGRVAEFRSSDDFARMKRRLTAAFVCVPCRRVFKRPSHRRVGDTCQALVSSSSPLCLHCRTALHRVGEAFRAPASDDLSEWERVACDISRGRTFVRDEGFGLPPVRQKRQRKPKGVRSLFQLPARKRGRMSDNRAPYLTVAGHRGCVLCAPACPAVALAKGESRLC